MTKPATEAQKRAIAKYDAKNTKQVHLKLNIHHDADIIEHLAKQEKVQTYIKELIREDMKNRPIYLVSEPIDKLPE